MASKDSPSKSSDFSKINPLDWLKSGWEAFRDAFLSDKNEKRNIFEKVGLWFQSFLEDMGLIEKERTETTAEAEAKVEKALGENFKKVTDTVTVPPDAPGAATMTWLQDAISAHTKSNLNDGQQKAAMRGLNKVQAAADGTPPQEVTAEEGSAIAGTFFLTLLELKKKYPSQAELEVALTDLYSAGMSKPEFASLLSPQALRPLMITDMSEGAKLLRKMGIEVDFVKEGLAAASGAVGSLVDSSFLSSTFGMSGDSLKVEGGEASKFLTVFQNFAKGGAGDQAAAVDLLLDKKIFKHTPRGMLLEVAAIAQGMFGDFNQNFTPNNLARMAFAIDNRDLESLAGRLLERQSFAAVNLVPMTPAVGLPPAVNN